jgi:hypothetical protein
VRLGVISLYTAEGAADVDATRSSWRDELAAQIGNVEGRRAVADAERRADGGEQLGVRVRDTAPVAFSQPTGAVPKRTTPSPRKGNGAGTAGREPRIDLHPLRRGTVVVPM